MRYTRDNETIAITLDDQSTSCGQAMYRTGIPNVQVLLLEADEEFFNAKHLEVSDMEEEILIESELRGALNSIELSLDNLYMNLNERACQMARTDIMMSQALLKANLETLHDSKGRTLFSHVAGEAVILYKCKPVEVEIRHDERKCCVELPVWTGSNFSTPAFVQPMSKRITLIISKSIGQHPSTS